MSDNKQEFVAFTVRNVSAELDRNLGAIASMEGKSKNALIIEALEREFLNPISSYGRKSGLVKAMDLEICRNNNLKLMDGWFENEHIIMADKIYREALNLENETDVDNLFKKSFPLIDIRAKQLLSTRDHSVFPSGISLTFALFIGVASSEPDVVGKIKKEVFGIVSEDVYLEHINEIRSLLGLENIHKDDC